MVIRDGARWGGDPLVEEKKKKQIGSRSAILLQKKKRTLGEGTQMSLSRVKAWFKRGREQPNLDKSKTRSSIDLREAYKFQKEWKEMGGEEGPKKLENRKTLRTDARRRVVNFAPKGCEN